MSLLAAGFLLGLGAIAAPVIIHLIHRQRYPERSFTTLRFFDKTIKHNVLQNRLIDKILLALRVLALAALALGLARPFFDFGLGEKRLSMVIVLDNSPTMLRQKDGKPLFDLARESVQKMVAALGKQDRVEILLTSPAAAQNWTSDGAELRRSLEQRAGRPTALFVRGEGGDALSIPKLSTDHAELFAALDKLPAGSEATLLGDDLTTVPRLDGDPARVNALLTSATISSISGDLPATLAQAAKLLNDSTDGDRKLVVLSDLQRGQWAGPTNESLKGLDVVVLPLESAAAGANLAIVSAGPEQAEASLGSTITGTAMIRNYGPGDSESAQLVVTAGDRNRPSEVKIPPLSVGATVKVNFPLRVMGRERELLCVASIKSSTEAFAYDNTWRFQVGVRPPITALVVSGFGAAGSARSGFYVVNALAPRGGSLMDSSVDPRECDVSQLKDQQLFQYGVVVLCGVQQLDADARQKLKAFVADGGGLLVFPSAGTSIDEYNGWEFLPAKLLKSKTGDFTYVKNLAQREPAVVPVADRVGSGVVTLSTNAWAVLEPAPGSKILATLAGGTPAMVEGSIGRGRVIVAATGAHLSDSDWPLRPAFVILLRELVSYLGAPAAPGALLPDRGVGESASVMLAPELAEGSPAAFRVDTGEADPVLAPLPYFQESNRLILPVAATPGHYLLSATPGRQPGVRRDLGLGGSTRAVSVNHDLNESDLPPLSIATLQSSLPGANIESKSISQDPATIVADLYSGGDFWRWLLGIALLVLVAESIVAWRWPSDGN